MKILRGAGQSYFALLYLALLPLPSIAADPPNIEGTWKIAAAQVSFKPEGASIPFTDQGRKRYQENKRKQAKRAYDDYDYMTSRCASPGLPRLMLTPDRFRIWQRPGLTMFLFEWNRLFRQIDVGGLPKRLIVTAGPGEEDNDALIGRAAPIANGHWEGDTLLVETKGFNEDSLIDNLVPHGDKMKLSERIRLKNADTLEDRITIEDPDYFTRPWQTVVVYQRQPDAPFPENVCIDRLPAAVQAQSAPARSGEPGGQTAVAPASAGPPPIPPLPPLPVGAPEPAADPHSFDGVWTSLGSPIQFQIVTDMFGNKVPFNAAGLKVMYRRVKSLEDGTPFINASSHCLPMGQPWQMDTPGSFHVFQSKDTFDIQFQEYHGFLEIVMDPAKAPPPGYMGRSVGHWDGDTLVVESSGFKEAIWVDSVGTPASRNAKLTQRIRKVKSDNWYLEVQYTLDDPTYYTRPWSWVRAYTWRPDMTLFSEYNCELQTAAPYELYPSLIPEPQE